MLNYLYSTLILQPWPGFIFSYFSPALALNFHSSAQPIQELAIPITIGLNELISETFHKAQIRQSIIGQNKTLEACTKYVEIPQACQNHQSFFAIQRKLIDYVTQATLNISILMSTMSSRNYEILVRGIKPHNSATFL